MTTRSIAALSSGTAAALPLAGRFPRRSHSRSVTLKCAPLTSTMGELKSTPHGAICVVESTSTNRRALWTRVDKSIGSPRPSCNAAWTPVIVRTSFK